MHRRSPAGVCAAVIAIATAVAGGCSVYEKDLLKQRRSGEPATATKDAAPSDAAPDSAKDTDAGDEGGLSVSSPQDCNWGDCWWSSGGSESCRSAGTPKPTDRPRISDRPSVPDIYVGLTSLRVGSTDVAGKESETAWQGFGFDLDGTCTNSSSCTGQTRQSCKPGSAAIPFDGELCRDNTFARLQPVIAAVPELGERFGLGEDVFNCELWRGGWNEIVRVSNYNGEPNDPQVRVDFYLSTGIQEELAWECPAKDFRTHYPRWLSSRKWGVVSNGLSGPITTPGTLPDSKVADVEAYVRGGYLVARFPDDSEQGFLGKGDPYRGFSFKVQKALFVGQLVQSQDGTWNMRDGLMAGRIRKTDLVQAFRNIGFCEKGELGAFYESMLTYVDENADLRADGINDAIMPCDAMSFALGFEAAQLLPGSAVSAPPRRECCAAGQSDEECSAKCGDGKVSGAEKCDTAIAEGQAGACPKSCEPTDSCTPRVVSGSECNATCEPMPITMAGAMDGCCPKGANATTDRDCKAACGNGVVETGETCDPPSSCKPCMQTDPCAPLRTIGNADSCNVRCQAMPITQCGPQDKCCPGSCSRANDSDCSASCGNGVIDMGETCEMRGNIVCPANCNDNNACTADATSGSAANCNIICSHTPITQAMAGDGCCPPGVGANDDSDCRPTCGNKLVEGGEQCDDGNMTAGDGCNNCMTETQQQQCLTRIGVDDMCSQCVCSKCTSAGLACYGAANAGDVTACRNMVDCGRMTKCGNPDCFCGSADIVLCLAGGGNGPCKDQVAAAGKTSSLFELLAAADNPMLPLGRANNLAACVDMNCAAACGR